MSDVSASSSPHGTKGAVFLSYAREDAEMVRRVADALRAFGVEVWFDQNELRGGDAWDGKIRTQIRTCSLFVPVISATTQARGEGYFRREWKIGADRTHDMAAGVPFLLPVVIDDTPESAALVPDEFMRVQWTRLPRGVPTAQFIEQVKKQLDSPGKRMEEGRSRSAERDSDFAKATTDREGTLPPKKAGPPVALWISIVAVLASVGGAFFVTRKQDASPAPAPAAEVKPAAATVVPRISDKSIAVLPFTNMSEDKEANAFFSDGIHEDILTNLALIRELRVVSRTSVLSYRNTTKSMKQIAQELGVTYILEGSVRRVGNKVRVTGQLIHAASDEHVWAQAYDRDLTDIFAIQTEVSRDIAGALKAALSPEEKIQIARRPTDNPDAYDLYLRARDVYNRSGVTQAASDERVALLQKAVELDPDFAQAWAELADAYAFAGFTFSPGMEELLARAKVAMDRAVKLAPDDSDVLRSLGTYYYYGFRDYAKATEQYERLARRQPNDPTLHFSLGLIQRRQGNWAKALASLRRATELDPGNIRFQRNVVITLFAARRYPELEAAQRRLTVLLPESLEEAFGLAQVPFFANGSTKEAEDFLAHLPAEKADSPAGIYLRLQWVRRQGNWAEAVRLDKLQRYYDGSGDLREEQAIYVAFDFFALGDLGEAKTSLAEYPAEMRKRALAEPRNARLLSDLSTIEIILGNKEAALHYADQAAAVTPISRDAVDGVTYEFFRVQTQEIFGDKARALADYQRLINVPSSVSGLVNVHSWRAGYSTLHGDPRFEAMLNDPKNNAPLF